MSNNYSHIMDKRSPKSPLVCERYKSGCAWGLMRFCDFHQDHSNRKLISNKKGLNTHVADDRFTKNSFDLLSNLEEKGHYIDDGAERTTSTTNSDKADITRIKGEETATEKPIKSKVTNTRAERLLSDLQPTVHVPKNHRRKKSKTFQMHGCKDIATLGSYENSVDISSKKSNTATLTEASCNPVHPKKGRDSRCRSINPQKHDQIGEFKLQVQMNEAAEAFINQKIIKGRYPGRDENHQSKHFLDALEILNSNKELFTKLLQDPNSLLVKHIQDLRDSQAKKEETKTFSEAKVSEICSIARKSEHPLKGSVDPQPSDTIVVLKPDLASMHNSAVEISQCSSPQSLYSLRNRAPNDKPAYFSFGQMKRKLRRAIGLRRKEKISASTGSIIHKSPCDIQGLGDDGKGKDLEVAESNLPCKVNFGIDRTMKASPYFRKTTSKAMDFESGIKSQIALNCGSDYENSKLSMVRHLKQKEACMDAESRKHLSEMLRKKNENFLRKQEAKTLGKTIFMTECDLTTLSPGRHQELGFVSAQTRFSPYSNYQMVNEKKQRLRKELENKDLSSARQTIEPPSWTDDKKSTDRLQTSKAKQNISQSHFYDIKVHESTCSISDTLTPRSSVKIVETFNNISPGEINHVGLSSEANDTCNTSSNQRATASRCEDNGNLEHSRVDSHAESCTSPTTKDTDGMKDKPEHASPVSVLEQFPDEDITSPPSTKLEPAKFTTEPKQINCEEHYSAPPVTSPEDLQINSSNVMDEHEPESKYVRALLQVSGINWNELSMKCHSSEQLLEPSLFDQVEALPDQSCADPRLLFDHINEVLLEVYQCYFSCSSWVSLVKPRFQPVLSRKNVDYEVMKCVNWDLLSQRPSLTLEQVVEKDLAQSGTWMDIRADTESAISEVVDSVLEELTWETAIELTI